MRRDERCERFFTDLEKCVPGVKFKRDTSNTPDIARMWPARLYNSPFVNYHLQLVQDFYGIR